MFNKLIKDEKAQTGLAAFLGLLITVAIIGFVVMILLMVTNNVGTNMYFSMGINNSSPFYNSMQQIGPQWGNVTNYILIALGIGAIGVILAVIIGFTGFGRQAQ